MRSADVRPDQPRWFHLHAIEAKIGERLSHALFASLNGLISIGIMAALAYWTHFKLIFPSLGPTAFLLFYTPLAPAASPRNTILGHLIGVLCGFGSLVLFGLTDAEAVSQAGVDLPRVGAAALSLAATAGLMVLFRVEHPPAGATTLIVSLGIIRKPTDLVILMIAVFLLCVQGLVINRLAGIPYPIWRKPVEAATPPKP